MVVDDSIYSVSKALYSSYSFHNFEKSEFSRNKISRDPTGLRVFCAL